MRHFQLGMTSTKQNDKIKLGILTINELSAIYHTSEKILAHFHHTTMQ